MTGAGVPGKGLDPGANPAWSGRDQSSIPAHEKRLWSQEAALRAIARNTRPPLVAPALLLTLFGVWRVIEVARFDYAIAAEIVGALDPVSAFFGLAVAYPGLFLGSLAAIVAWPIGRAFEDQIAKPIRGLLLAAGLLALLWVIQPSDVWLQALWVVYIVLCLKYVWLRVMQLTQKGSMPGEPSLLRALSAVVMISLAVGLAGPFQRAGGDDLPWQPVEEVRFKREPGGTVETMTGALLTHDQHALTYLQLEPRRVVWLEPAQIERRSLCDRTGANCVPGLPG